MKRGTKLLILALVLVLVGLGAWGISQLTDDGGTPMSQGDLLFSLEGVKNLSWTYGDRTIRFDISQEEWVNLDYPEYQITGQWKKAITDEITQINSRKDIGKPGNLAAYGLAQPRCTVVADDVTITIGNANAMGNQVYFSMGDGKVYLVNSTILSPFTHSLEEMAVLEQIPDLSGATSIGITTLQESFTVEKGENGWFLTDDVDLAVDQQISTGLFAHVKALDWLKCVDCTQPDLAQYGLDNPAAVYQIAYEGGSFTILLGNSTDEGVYAMPQGGNMVYLVDATAGNAMLAMNTNDIIG